MGADVETPLLVDEEDATRAERPPSEPTGSFKPQQDRARRVGLVLSLIVLTALMAAVMCSLPPLDANVTPVAATLDADATLLDVHALLSTKPWTFVQLAEPGLTAQEVLHDSSRGHINSYVVIATGKSTPSRRTSDQAFLTVDATLSLPAIGTLNRVAVAVERVLGRHLFPVTLRSARFDDYLPKGRSMSLDQASDGSMAAGVRPYAVFDLSTGELVVDQSVTDGWSTGNVQFLMSRLAEGVFNNMASMLSKIDTRSSVGGGAAVVPLLAAAAALALPAAFAAAPPMWFCIACPTVLGLLAPLVINLGLGQLAGVACSRLELTDDACFDLMLGSLGLGFVLSLASAVPIFMVCRMYECSHRDAPPSAFLAARVLAPVLMRMH